jgi:hypothetical protein
MLTLGFFLHPTYERYVDLASSDEMGAGALVDVEAYLPAFKGFLTSPATFLRQRRR